MIPGLVALFPLLAFGAFVVLDWVDGFFLRASVARLRAAQRATWHDEPGTAQINPCRGEVLR